MVEEKARYKLRELPALLMEVIFPSQAEVRAALAIEYPQLQTYTYLEYRQAILFLRPEEIANLVWKYKLLKPSASSFSRSHQLNEGNFSRWLRGKKESPTFVEIVRNYLLKGVEKLDRVEKAQENCLSLFQALEKIKKRVSAKDCLPLKALILFDADNYPSGMAELGLLLPREDEDWSVHMVWVRMKGGHNLPWSHSSRHFTCVWTHTRCKDAADQTITWMASRLSLTLAEEIKFILVSQDDFVEEVLAILRSEGRVAQRVKREQLSLYLLFKERELLSGTEQYNQRIDIYLDMSSTVSQLLEDCPSFTQYIKAAKEMIPAYAKVRRLNIDPADVENLSLFLAEQKKKWPLPTKPNPLLQPLNIDQLSDEELRQEYKFLWSIGDKIFAHKAGINLTNFRAWLQGKEENWQSREAVSRWLKKRLGLE